MTDGMYSPILGPIAPLIKQVYQDALTEQLNREVRFHSWVTGRFDAEQQARIEAAKDKREKERKELLDLLATAEGTVKAIVELHHTDKWDECEGCDFGGWEGDKPSWPCRTIDLIAESLKGEN